MTANELITHDIPFLKPADTVKTALKYLAEQGIDTLPVVENAVFQGFVLEDQLLDEKSNVLVANLLLHHSEAKVYADTHALDVLKRFKMWGIKYLTVLNQEGGYLGVATLENTANYLSELTFVQSNGGIVVLSLPANSYSLTEIGRIIESNGQKALAIYTHESPDNTTDNLITIKLNQTDLTRLIASFERFGYKIVAEFHEKQFEHIDVERLEMLWKYLNI